MSMPIIIPTLGRGRIMTLEWFDTALFKNTTLVTAPEQVAELQRGYPEIKVLGCPLKGISATRQWIAEKFNRCVMVDDDLRFSARNNQDWKDVKLTPCTPIRLRAAFDRMENLLRQHPMVGMSARQGNNNMASRTEYAVRMWNCWAIDCERARRYGFRFDAVPVMEDFWMNLSFLTAGHSTALLGEVCHDQYGSNQAGGCSGYRTTDVQTRGAQLLAARFPGFVKIVQKEANNWKGFGGVRTDVTVQWKKALEFGKQHGHLI